MIGYSNQPLTVRPKISLDSSREVAQGCEVSFVKYLYLIPIIIGQNLCYVCYALNQTGPFSYHGLEYAKEPDLTKYFNFKNANFRWLHNNIILCMCNQLRKARMIRYNS